MKRMLVGLIVLVMFGLFPVRAQDDVKQIQYGTPLAYTFAKANDQMFAQFQGKKGDLVTLMASYSELVFGSLKLDLRDTVGRSLGVNTDFSLKNFILAQLPADGTYTVVVSSDQAKAVNVNLSKVAFLSDTASSFTTTGKSSLQIIGINVSKSGEYTVHVKRTAGEMAAQFAIVHAGATAYSSDNIVEINGDGLDDAVLSFHLEAGEQYFAALDRPLVVFDNNASATLDVSLAPAS